MAEINEFEVAFAIAAILMILTLLINLAAALVERYFKRKKNNALLWRRSLKRQQRLGNGVSAWNVRR